MPPSGFFFRCCCCGCLPAPSAPVVPLAEVGVVDVGPGLADLPVILWRKSIHLIFVGDESWMPSLTAARDQLRAIGAGYDAQKVPKPREYVIYSADHSRVIMRGDY